MSRIEYIVQKRQQANLHCRIHITLASKTSRWASQRRNCQYNYKLLSRENLGKNRVALLRDIITFQLQTRVRFLGVLSHVVFPKSISALVTIPCLCIQNFGAPEDLDKYFITDLVTKLVLIICLGAFLVELT